MEQNGRAVQNGRFSRLLHSTWGVVLVIAAALAAGWIAANRFGDIEETPQSLAAVQADVSALKLEVAGYARAMNESLSVHSDSLTALSRRTIWNVCAAVPPYRPDVLSALDVNCRYVADLPALPLWDSGAQQPGRVQ